MIYPYIVKYKGKWYQSGENVPNDKPKPQPVAETKQADEQRKNNKKSKLEE